MVSCAMSCAVFFASTTLRKYTVTLHSILYILLHCTMKTTILLTLVSSAAAFVAPSTRSSVGTALSAFSDESGVLLPTGYFDPLRLATTQEKFDQYRAAEIKHGRVAMLAVVGYVVPEFYRWGGDIAPGLKFADIPNGVAAIEAVPFLGWAQIFFLVGAVDYVRCLYRYCMNIVVARSHITPSSQSQRGIFQYDIGKPDLAPEVLKIRETQELQNGRIAMLAILELLRHDSQNSVVPGFDGLDNLITGLPFLYN